MAHGLDSFCGYCSNSRRRCAAMRRRASRSLCSLLWSSSKSFSSASSTLSKNRAPAEAAPPRMNTTQKYGTLKTNKPRKNETITTAQMAESICLSFFPRCRTRSNSFSVSSCTGVTAVLACCSGRSVNKTSISPAVRAITAAPVRVSNSSMSRYPSAKYGPSRSRAWDRSMSPIRW
ncbi:hypothetical protein CGBL_0115610 [Corynebacterium glutamicum]|nr:hypothetical protein CGBL_0115610 [Corynebacterium glutamicum]